MDFKAAIRTIPDYPKPGIMFRDITTLLGNPRAFRSAGLRQGLQSSGEALGHHRAARFFSRFIQLGGFRAQYAGQG